jgi:hypothetical protein
MTKSVSPGMTSKIQTHVNAPRCDAPGLLLERPALEITEGAGNAAMPRGTRGLACKKTADAHE